MGYDYRPFDYVPHAVLARYYAYGFLTQRPETPRPPRRPSRLAAAAKRLAVRIGQAFTRRPQDTGLPELQGCG